MSRDGRSTPCSGAGIELTCASTLDWSEFSSTITRMSIARPGEYDSITARSASKDSVFVSLDTNHYHSFHHELRRHGPASHCQTATAILAVHSPDRARKRQGV